MNAEEEKEAFKAKLRSIQFAGYKYSTHGWGRDNTRKNQRNLDSYAASRKAGNQPDGTKQAQVDFANKEADRLGRPYRGEDRASTYYPELAKALTGKLPMTLEE